METLQPVRSRRGRPTSPGLIGCASVVGPATRATEPASTRGRLPRHCLDMHFGSRFEPAFRASIPTSYFVNAGIAKGCPATWALIPAIGGQVTITLRASGIDHFGLLRF